MKFAHATTAAMLFLALALPASAQQVIEWAKDWDAALEEAKARNVPMMFTVHQDG